MINVGNYICLHCTHAFSTIKNEKEIIRCPMCGSHKLGKKEYNQPRIKIDNPNRWRHNEPKIHKNNWEQIRT